MKKILVPTDGSNNSKKALIKAKEYAEKFDAEVVILNVAKAILLNTDIIPQYTIDTNKDLNEEGQRILRNSLEIFNDSKVKVKTKLKTGDSSIGIIEEIKDGDYDLVIMGSRGRGAFSRIMLGSVSNTVLNNADINVLIVK